MGDVQCSLGNLFRLIDMQYVYEAFPDNDQLQEGACGTLRTAIPASDSMRWRSNMYIGHIYHSRTKNQPKEEVFGTDIPRTSGGHSRDILAQNFGQGSPNPGGKKNKHFGADIHDPKARTSTTLRGFQKLRLEELWFEFSFPNHPNTYHGRRVWLSLAGNSELHCRGRCRFNSCPRPIRITWQMQISCLAVSMLWGSLFVADLIVGMEELELHYICRGWFTINTKIFAIQNKFLRGINFIKITRNIFQSTRLPEERMGVTKKIGGRNEFP